MHYSRLHDLHTIMHHIMTKLAADACLTFSKWNLVEAKPRFIDSWNSSSLPSPRVSPIKRWWSIAFQSSPHSGDSQLRFTLFFFCTVIHLSQLRTWEVSGACAIQFGKRNCSLPWPPANQVRQLVDFWTERGVVAAA